MPTPFAEKEIVLGVTGSVAAHKACDIASCLVKGGARVQAALTRSANEFIGVAGLEALTKQRVITEMFEPLSNPEIEHISVARRADLFLIAPATANILAKAAQGIADDWLSTTLLATRAPILFAPAMNTMMYEHPATQANIETLCARGCSFVGPGAGTLACGEVGPGRLAETPQILEAVQIALCAEKDLAGKRVVITSGGTREAIDPVRYISNRSSGKMGYCLALEALCRGAEVTVVTGPGAVPPPGDAETVPVESAQEMYQAVSERFEACDIFIAAAAVADYRMERPESIKRKRGSDLLTLTLVPNPDIAATMGARKRADQAMIGFAAETNHVIAQGREKLTKKNFDLLVANQVGGEDCAFDASESHAAILTPLSDDPGLERLSKAALATKIFDTLIG